MTDLLRPPTERLLVRSLATQQTLARAESTLAASRNLLTRIADQAQVSAAIEDSAADAMLEVARQMDDLERRDRLVVLAERARSYADRQRSFAWSIQDGSHATAGMHRPAPEKDLSGLRRSPGR